MKENKAICKVHFPSLVLSPFFFLLVSGRQYCTAFINRKWDYSIQRGKYAIHPTIHYILSIHFCFHLLVSVCKLPIPPGRLSSSLPSQPKELRHLTECLLCFFCQLFSKLSNPAEMRCSGAESQPSPLAPVTEGYCCNRTMTSVTEHSCIFISKTETLKGKARRERTNRYKKAWCRKEGGEQGGGNISANYSVTSQLAY